MNLTIEILNTKSPMRTYYTVAAPMEARTEWQRTVCMQALSMWRRLNKPSVYETNRRGFRFRVRSRKRDAAFEILGTLLGNL